jgi:hypothetical protein
VVQVSFKNVALQYEAGKLTFALDQNKPCRFQFFEVMGKRGGRYGLALPHIRASDAAILSANLLQDLMAPRVRQGLRDQTYLPL